MAHQGNHQRRREYNDNAPTNGPEIVAGIMATLRRQENVILGLLGEDVPLFRFLHACETALKGNPYILTMPAETIVAACLQAAQDRLLPDGTQGAIVPRYNWKTRRKEATWQPMYQGILLLAKKYAGVASIVCELVYEGEHYRRTAGTNPGIEHEPDPDLADIEKLRAGYVVFNMRDGTQHFEVMSRKMLDAVRDGTESVKQGKDSPWTGPFADQMYKKTLIHRGWKFVPITGEGAVIVTRAVNRIYGDHAGMPTPDTLAEAGIKVQVEGVPEPQKPAGSAFDTTEDKLAAIRDQLAAITDGAQLDAWTKEPRMAAWLDGLRRNQPQNFRAVMGMIAAHRAAIEPDSRDEGGEGLPLFAPDPETDEWKLHSIGAYTDDETGEVISATESWKRSWRNVLRHHGRDVERLDAENRIHFRAIAECGEEYDSAVADVSKMIATVRKRVQDAKAQPAEALGK